MKVHRTHFLVLYFPNEELLRFGAFLASESSIKKKNRKSEKKSNCLMGSYQTPVANALKLCTHVFIN